LVDCGDKKTEDLGGGTKRKDLWEEKGASCWWKKKEGFLLLPKGKRTEIPKPKQHATLKGGKGSFHQEKEEP